MRLTRSVEESFVQLQDRWLLLNSAFLRDDAVLIESAADDLRGTIEALGFEEAPDLALALAVRGLEMHRRGETDAGDLAFSVAERLDLDSPALAFARSKASWESGRFIPAVFQLVRGYGLALTSGPAKRLALLNLGIWWMLSLLVASALFIALQFATKGSLVVKDLRMLVPVHPLAGGAFAIVALVAPLVLPSGWLWAALTWGILLWGYGSSSERWMMSLSLVLLGLIPTLFSFLAEDMPLVASPEERLLDHLAERSLYGQLLTDLAVLEGKVDDDPAALHLLADVHQALGQDDVARPYYQQVVDGDPFNGTALNNLGVFHLVRREYVAAIDFLQQAAEIEESAPAAGYNLSGVYDQLLEFGNSQRYLRLAREASAEDVGAWEEAELEHVTLQGGFERIPALRTRLALDRQRSLREMVEHLESLGLALASLGLAVVLPWLGFGGSTWRAGDVVSDRRIAAWVRWLVPGLRSAEAGDGGRAFVAVLLPTAIVLWLVAGRFGYALPWGLEPGSLLVALITAVALLGFFVARGLPR